MLARHAAAVLAATVVLLMAPGAADAKSRAAPCASIIATIRPAPPSMKSRRYRSPSPSWGCSTISCCSTRTSALNSLETIVPDLASSWSWDESKTRLTFKLREGVKWHDGKPFTAKDVQCTWHALIGKDGTEEFRRNPRKVWYYNLKEVTTNGDHEATFHLGHPQPSFLLLLASGFSPVYPCHVSHGDMRTKPIGTGPFKLAELNRNVSIKTVRNPDYWKPGRPLRRCAGDAHHRQPFHAHPWFRVGRLRHDLRQRRLRSADEGRGQAGAEGHLRTAAEQRQHQFDRQHRAPPFDNPQIRKAMALAIDRKAFIDILTEGKAAIGGAMLPAPEGLWAMPPEELAKLPGYGDDTEKNLAEARKIMEVVGIRAGQDAEGESLHQEYLDLSRSRRHPHRPAEENLHRWCARPDRHHRVVRQGAAQGLHRRSQPDRRRRRRSGR